MPKAKNPVVKIREDLDMTREDLSRIANISYSAIYAVERGNALSISRKILKALQDLGYDPQKIAEDYMNYKQQLSKELKSKYANAK